MASALVESSLSLTLYTGPASKGQCPDFLDLCGLSEEVFFVFFRGFLIGCKLTTHILCLPYFKNFTITFGPFIKIS